MHHSNRKTPGCRKGRPPRVSAVVLGAVPGHREKIPVTVAKAERCLNCQVDWSCSVRARTWLFLSLGKLLSAVRERRIRDMRNHLRRVLPCHEIRIPGIPAVRPGLRDSLPPVLPRQALGHRPGRHHGGARHLPPPGESKKAPEASGAEDRLF